MSAAIAAPAVRPAARGQMLTAGIIVGLAVLTGLAAGDPAPQWWIPLALIAGGSVLYAGARWPFASLLIMLCSSILLVVVRASGVRSVNLIDVLLPPVLLVSVFGAARRDACAHVQRGPAHDRLHKAEQGFTRAVVVFYACAVLSLFELAHEAGTAAALDSGLLLIRAVQGLLIYPLCMWWLRSRERVEQAWNALFIAGVVFAAVNLVGVTLWHVPRAGMALYLNDPDGPIAGPNEGGATTLIVAAVLLVRQSMRPDWKNLALAALMLVLLVLTQSRSALLAWATFGLLTLRWVRPARLVTGALTLLALLPLVPMKFWTRMVKSAAVQRGSFEAFSFLERVYGWQAASHIVQQHPWTGIGYLGFRFVSHRYNELRVVLITVENYFYEILVSMGIVGLGMLLFAIVKLFQLGQEVGRTAPRGTLAYHMARFHAPLMLGLLVANLTGDNFVGMACLAQMAMWVAVLVCSGHAAVAESTHA